MDSARSGPGPATVAPETVATDESDRASRLLCSWSDVGWRSALLRQLDNHADVQYSDLPAIPDQMVLLVTHGQAVVETARDGGPWRSARLLPGSLSMTAPGRRTALRWTAAHHHTLHLYLPGTTVVGLVEETWGRTLDVVDLPDAFGIRDALAEQTMRRIGRAARGGAEDMFVEAATPLLLRHLLAGRLGPATPCSLRDDVRVRRAIDYMHDNLAAPLTLTRIAAAVELSAYHFARIFKSATGEPPRRYLNRLRVETASRHLARDDHAVTDIAYLCGFGSPAHLSTMFRAHVGVPPSVYRRSVRDDEPANCDDENCAT